MGIWAGEDKLFTETGCEDFVVPSFSELSAFCTRRMTKGLCAKFKKQCGKDGTFASLSLRLHKGFEGFGSTAGRVKNEDEPQVRSECQIKEEQYIYSKQKWLGFFFFLLRVGGKVLLTPLSTSFLCYFINSLKSRFHYSFLAIEVNSWPLLLSNNQLFPD